VLPSWLVLPWFGTPVLPSLWLAPSSFGTLVLPSLWLVLPSWLAPWFGTLVPWSVNSW